jgi:membrane-bound metal-dependent hydrolase YbcI (DUF457 family)
MPSPLGHALAGVATAWSATLIARRPVSRLSPTTLAVLCATLAALPDADLFFPSTHRMVTHSVGAIALTFILAAGVTGWVTGRVPWRLVLVCTAAYGSHVLLDWLGVDLRQPRGIQALWPLSHAWYASDWAFFPRTERRAMLSWPTVAINLKAALFEVGILGSLVAALGWATLRRTRRSLVQPSAPGGRLRPSGGAEDTAGTSDRRIPREAP